MNLVLQTGMLTIGAHLVGKKSEDIALPSRPAGHSTANVGSLGFLAAVWFSWSVASFRGHAVGRGEGGGGEWPGEEASWSAAAAAARMSFLFKDSYTS